MLTAEEGNCCHHRSIVWFCGCVLCGNWLAAEQQAVAAEHLFFGSGAVCFVLTLPAEEGLCCRCRPVLWSGAVCFVLLSWLASEQQAKVLCSISAVQVPNVSLR